MGVFFLHTKARRHSGNGRSDRLLWGHRNHGEGGKAASRDHPQRTCGSLFSPGAGLIVSPIYIDRRAVVNKRWPATLISGRCFFFSFFISSSSLFNLSGRAAVNCPRRRGGRPAGPGSPPAAPEVDTPGCLGIFSRCEEEPFRSNRDLSVSIEMTVVRLTRQPRAEGTRRLLTELPAEIGGVIDNHSGGHCSWNSGGEDNNVEVDCFHPTEAPLDARTVKQNRKQIEFCRTFLRLGCTGGEAGSF